MINTKPLLISIDGPSSSGKGTVAKKVAKYFGLSCLNTGALYRAIAFLALKEGLDLQNDISKIVLLCDKIIQNKDDAVNANLSFDLESPEIHNEEIGKAASIVAGNPEIRKALFNLQKNFAKKGIRNDGGAVLEGRDIGTTICPDANYKFFIIADVKVRAERRFKQLKNNSKEADFDVILKQLENRDEQDTNRASSPLKKAEDAIEIDTSKMSAEEVFQKILNCVENR
ncbi:MAG: cytidylate kinase [Rickettsiales bacterium]|jgi:cytidylate kinase